MFCCLLIDSLYFTDTRKELQTTTTTTKESEATKLLIAQFLFGKHMQIRAF